MAFADTIKYNRIRSMKGLPIGAIVPWASDQSEIPPGWVSCNGATVANTKYPVLFKIIGNAYGGTAGSTFRLPPLTQGSPGIVDVFRGHYVYFKGTEINALPGNEVNRPTSTSDTFELDPFWSIIGRGTNGDSGSNTQTFWISTIDLVGVEQSTSVQFQGLYDEMEVSDGSYFWTANYSSTSLGVQHLPAHSHGENSAEAPSYDRRGDRASECGGRRLQSWPCWVNCNSTSAFRVAFNPAMHIRVSRGNNQTHLWENFTITDARTGWVGNGGGGGFMTTTLWAETNATVYRDGNGRCSGNMRCGNNILFTSLSHEETNAGAEHTHGPNNYSMQGRYSVVSPGLRRDIALNTVRINNSPGQNYGTISVDTTTPSLEMLYLIRAY